MGRKAVRALPVLGAGLLTLAAIAATLHPFDAASRPVPEMLRASTFRLSSGDAIAAAGGAVSRAPLAPVASTPEG